MDGLAAELRGLEQDEQPLPPGAGAAARLSSQEEAPASGSAQPALSFLDLPPEVWDCTAAKLDKKDK